MTLKAVWITGEHGVHTLTLESDGIAVGEQTLVIERTFPADNPTRHTTQLIGLSTKDLDALRRLLDAASPTGDEGYAQLRESV